MPDLTWSTASHDVIPPPDLGVVLRDVPTYLHAFLRSEHAEFREPYSDVRRNIDAVIAENTLRQQVAAQRPRSDVEGQRLRTWKKTFEEFGFCFVDDDQRLRTTRLGQLIRDTHDDLAQRVAGANEHIVSLVLTVLGRHVLRNPIAAGEYPPDGTLHPYRAIWQAVRALDDRIHWEELNRVIMRVLRDEDVPAAISHIRQVRASVATRYDDAALQRLGPRAAEDGDETRRRVTPWLSRAGVGNTVLVPDGDDGYWRLVPRYTAVIDEVLGRPLTPPPAEALQSRSAYLRYVIDGVDERTVRPSTSDSAKVAEVRRAVERFGHRKIICLSGVPGTGKSRLARLVAEDLTDGDPYRLQEIQFHDGTTYDKFVEGFVPRPDGTGYQLLPMTLRVINQRAERDTRGRTYVLLIEELTRADVHAVLGELLTYIEHRGRPFRLALSQEETRIAPNLVVLATMNPRDRSALTLDHAILRRMHQVPVAPDPDVLRELARTNLAPEVAAPLEAWYRRYAALLPFGHGEFASATSAEDLRDLWRGTLRHFLVDAVGELKEQYLDAAESYPWR